MKKRVIKGMALTMAIMLALPMLSLGNANIANAKSKKTQCPNFSVNSTEKRTTHIKHMKHPYGTGTDKLSATAISITTHHKDDDTKKVITVGKSYNFDSKISPRKTKDNTYWYIDKTEFATVDKRGVVTGLKAGTVLLTAVASETEAGVATSTVRDTIVIEIALKKESDVKTANVLNVALSDATKLTITFDKAMNPSTLMDVYNKLLNSVIIVPKVDANGVAATPLGVLTASLSKDGKTLTIQSTANFKGLYGIYILPTIKTAEGNSLVQYYKDITLNDTQAPSYVGYTLDNTGLIVTLNFSEAMDFTNMQPFDAQVITCGQTTLPTALPATLGILNTKLNYVASLDKKSLTINLTSMTTADQNKMFSVRLYGAKDLAGNNLNNDWLISKFGTKTLLPQPVCIPEANHSCN